MLVARGKEVAFILEDGRKVSAPHGSYILHDPSGNDWPSDSVLIARFKHTGELESRASSAAKDHFGGEEILRGRIVMPQRRMGWREIGEVRSILYTFTGPHYAPEGHEHEFKRMPLLSRKGHYMRLDGLTTGPNGFRS